MKSYFLLGYVILFFPLIVAAQDKFSTNDFLYGTSVYPEIQTKEDQIKTLDLFKEAGFTVLRLGESTWGNLQPAENRFDFDWLTWYLDEMHKRGLRAILGTCSYIPPQWLVAKHPDILMWYADGSRANPMGRHAESRNNPNFRTALEKFILTYAGAFKDHPAVIGWQLDNEIDQNVGRVDYNPANKEAWVKWLKKEYKTTAALNGRLGLKSWGLLVDSIEHVPLPSKSNDGELPAISLAALKFDKDNIAEYLRWQATLLRKAGVSAWITTDWNMLDLTIADDTAYHSFLDVSSINQYQPTSDNFQYWARQGAFNAMHRSVSGNGAFLVTETRIGSTGGEKIWTPVPTKDQFKMWMLQPVAYGAVGVLHWSGNRFTGGHWPHWGGLLNWSGNPEPDYYWAKELAAFFKKWGGELIRNKVDAKAAVITDFDQRAMMHTYPHAMDRNGVKELQVNAFEAFSRNGIGVDALTSAGINSRLAMKYNVVLMSGVPALDNTASAEVFHNFVTNGGTLIVGPIVDYQTKDGIFKKSGFGKVLEKVTGNSVETIRQIDTIEDGNFEQWTSIVNGRHQNSIKGFCEILGNNVADVVATFDTKEDIVNNKPAATIRKLGKGFVLKLAYWPIVDDLSNLLSALKVKNPVLGKTLPPGVQAVPRTDGSIFILNNESKPKLINVSISMVDRISDADVSTEVNLPPYGVLWLTKKR